MNTFNVDEFLEEAAIEIIIGGKTFIVKDMPQDLQEKTDAGVKEQDTKKLLAAILQCKESDVKDIGVKATGAIIEYITKNLFTADDSADTQSID
jgi:hypothetical protein